MKLYVFRCSFDILSSDVKFFNIREVEVRETPKMYVASDGKDFFRLSSRVSKAEENMLFQYLNMYFMFSTNPSSVPFKKAVEEDIEKRIERNNKELLRLNTYLANFSNSTMGVSKTTKWFDQ